MLVPGRLIFEKRITGSGNVINDFMDRVSFFVIFVLTVCSLALVESTVSNLVSAVLYF